MLCEIASNSGLFTGLWHGLIAIFALFADLIWDVPVYDQCSNSWFYNLGFLVGVMILGRFALVYGLMFLIPVLVIWIIATLLGTILIGAVLAVVVIIALTFWDEIKYQFSKR